MEEFILEQNISSSFVENFIKQNPKISDLGETNLDWENELLIKEEKSRNLSHLSFPAVQQNDDFNELPNCLCLNNDEKSQKILDIPPKTPLVCQDKNIQKPDVNVISPPNDTQSFTFLDPFSSPTCKSALKGLCMNATNTSWTSSLASPPPTKPSQTSPIETQPKVQKSSICYHDTPFCLSNKLSSSPATLTSDKSLNTFFNSSFSTKISFNKPAVESLALASLLQESSIHKSPPTSVTHFTFKAFPLVTSSSQKTHHKVQKQKCNSQFLNIEGGETCPCINISNLKKSPKVNHSLTIGNNYQTLKSPNNSPKLQESPAKIHSTNSMHSEDLSIFFSSPASTKSKQEKKVPKKKALKRKNVDDDVFRIDLEDDIKNINNTSPHNTQLDTTNADDNHSVTNIFHTSYTCNKTSPNKNVENDAQESNKRGVDEKNDTSVTDSMLYNATTGSELESGCLQSGGHAVEKTPTNSQNILNPDNYIMKTHDKDTAEKQISNTHILNNEILMMNNASQLYSPTSPFINQHHFTTSTPIRPPKHHVPRTKLFNQISEYPDKILSTQLTKKNKVDGSRARVDGNNVQNCNDDSTIKSQKQNHLSSHLQEVEKMLDGSNTVTIKNKINDEEIQNPPSSTHTPIHTVEDAAGTNDVPTIQPTAHHKLKNSQSSSFSMRNKRSKKFLYPTQAQIISSMPTFVLNNNSQLKQRYNLTLSDEKSKLNENKELCDNYEGYAKHFENYESSKVDLYRIPLGPITTWKNEDKAKLFLYSSLKLQEVETRDKHPSSTIIHKDVPYFNSGLQSDLHDVFTPCEYETAQNAITSYGKVIKTEDTTVGAMLANKLSSVEKQDSCKVSTNNRIHEKDAISRYHTKNDLQSYSTYNTLFDNINIGNNNNLNIGNNNKKNNLNIGNNNKNNNLNVENNNKNFKKDLHVKDNRVCTGFTTGKGGRVEVGATSLHQAGVMLAEKEGVLPCMQNIKPHYNINNNNMGNNDNSHGNNVNDNINNCKKSNNNINNSDNNNNNNDNNVNNNNKANNRNKNGINNNSGDSSDNVDINNDKKQRVTGFRTAGGDRLKVGEDVLHAALTLMDAASDGLPLMHGLSTIRSKPNELDASKFEQDNYIGIGGVQRLKSTTGFKTANGHGLKVNKDTFKKAEVVLTSDDNEVKLKGNAGRYMQSRGYTESCVTDVETGHLTTSQAREVNEVSVLCNTHEFVSTQAFFLGKIEEGYDEVGGDKKGRTSDEGDDEGVEFVEDKVCDSSKHSTSGVFDGFDDDFCDYFDNDKEGGGKQCTDDATPLNNGEYVVCSQQPPSIHQNEFSSRHQNELMKDHSYDVKHDRHYWLASNKMAEKKKEEKDEWGESENYWLMDFMEGDVCDDSSKINNVKNNDEGNNSKNNTTKNSSPSNKDGSHTKDIKQGDNITTITSDQTPTISPLQLPPRLHHHHSSDVTGNFMVTSIKDGEGDKKQNGDKKVLFFQSVRGRKVEVTGQSLKMVKEVLCDNMVSNEKGTESNEKGGVSNEKVGGMASVSTKPSLFQTANGKSVAISEKSMNFVKEMFKDTDISSNANNNNNLNNKNNNHFNKYDHFNNKNNINTLDTNRQPEDIVTKDDVMNDKTKLSKDFVVMKSSKVTNVSSSAFGSNLNIEAYNIPSINTDITQTTSKRNDSKHVSGAPRDITNPVGSIKKVETHPGICVKTSFCTPYNNSVNNVNVESDQHSNANTLTCQFYNTHDDTITQQAFLTEENVNLLKSERELQKMAIEKKMRSAKIKPSMGSLSLLKDANKGSRTQLRDLSKGGCPNNDISKMKEHGVRDNVIGVTAANAEEFKFQRSTSMETEEGGIIIPNDEGFITNQEFHAALVSMRGVDANLVDQGWVCNHYRWVVWKLASMERSFPEVYGGVLLRPEVVMSQLRWRYDEEIVGGRRSVIKRITENDDTPRRGMVLCVVEVEGRERVVLTDGWYCIKCLFDEALWSFLQRKKIKIGTKLVIFGAVLVGNTQACSPLQAPEDMALKISANSTRRALWHAKLGCLVSRKVFKIALNSIVLNGGTVCCVDVVVVRRYPRMFCEWVMENVKGIVRSERLEKKFADAFERKKQKELEEFYEKCQSDFEKKKTKNRKNHMCSTEMETNEEEVEERRREMEVFMKERLQEWKVAHPDRKVRSLLKFQVKGCHWSDVDSAFSCWLTVRDMGGEVDELMREGKRMLISNLTVHTDRHARIHLNTCRSSKFQTLPIDHNFLDLLFQPRHTSTFQHIHSECLSCEVTHHEFDVVCLVVMVTEMCKSESGLQQMIYVVDEEGGVGRLRFWGGLVAYGVESLIKEGLIIACSNLKVDKYYCRDIKKGSSLNHSCNTSFNKSTLSSYQLMNNSSSKNISKTSSNYPTFFFDQSSPNCSNFSTAATPSQWVLMQVNDLTEFTTRPRSPQLKCSFNALNAKLKVKKNHILSIKKVVLNSILSKTTNKRQETSLTLCSSTLSNSSFLLNNTEIDNNKENLSYKSTPGKEVETGEKKDGDNLLKCSQNSLVKDTPMKNNQSGRILRSHARASGLKGKRKSENSDSNSREKIRKRETNCSPAGNASLQCHSILDTTIFTTSLVSQVSDDNISEIVSTQKITSNTTDDVGVEEAIVSKDDESYITSSYVDQGKEGLCYESSVRDLDGAMFDDDTGVGKMEYNEDLLSGVDWMSETQFIY